MSGEVAFIWSPTAPSMVSHRAVATGDPDWPYRPACGVRLDLAAALTGPADTYVVAHCRRCFPEKES